MDEEAEKICVQRFLKWYNKQYKRNYIFERAKARFPNLKEGDWDFIAYEPDNRQEWIGIEVKDLSTTRENHIWYKFWEKLCLELTKDLVGRGNQGEFSILPPVLYLKPKERQKFREAFIKVLTDNKPILKANKPIDIGPNIAAKFTNWPREKKGNLEEYYKWGEYCPSELRITKRADSGCEVTLLTNPIVVQDASETHKKTFSEANMKHENKQLNLAKEKGARETILLFACYPFIYEGLIKNEVQNLDSHLIYDIDYIYLVGMSKDIAVKIYPN